MGLYKSLSSILCYKHISLIENLFHTIYLHCVYKMTFETKMSYYAKYDIHIIRHFLVQPNVSY